MDIEALVLKGFDELDDVASSRGRRELIEVQSLDGKLFPTDAIGRANVGDTFFAVVQVRHHCLHGCRLIRRCAGLQRQNETLLPAQTLAEAGTTLIETDDVARWPHLLIRD